MNKLIVLLAVLFFTLTSCFRERIELDYNQNENKKVVITGWITTLDEPQFIQVSQTVNYLGSYVADMISDAEVTLADAENTYVLTEQEKGFYYLPADWSPTINDTYTLKVIHLEEEFTATHKLRACPDIAYLDFEIDEVVGDTTYYHTLCGFQDLPGLGDGYYGLDYLKGTAYKDSLRNGNYIDDEFFEGEFFGDIAFTEDDRRFMKGDTAVIDLINIGVESTKFIQDIESEIYRGSPFDPPPENVRTNIEGGAIGYFIIGDARRAEIVIE